MPNPHILNLPASQAQLLAAGAVWSGMALPRMMFAAVRSFRRAYPLLRDNRVPTALKAITGIVALLIISPLDVFGDIPVLGVLDDAVLLSLLCMLFVWLATQALEKNVTPVRREAGGPPMVS